MRRPTRNDVAKRAQVSGATVSRVLSNSPLMPVSEETRARVLEAADALGYRLNHAARSLVTGRTHTVGLWIMDSFTAFYSSVASHLEDQAAAHHFRVAVQHTASYMACSRNGTEYLAWDVDGMIACDVPNDFQPYLASLRTHQMPVVTMGVYYAEQGDYVAIDLFAGAMQAMAHLMAPGCKRIALLV